MKSLSYEAGKAWSSLGSFGQVAVIAAAVIGGGALAVKTHERRQIERVTIETAAKAASAAELAAWQEERAAFLQAKCVTNAASMVAEAASSIRAGDPDSAVRLMAECDGSMTDPKAIAQLERARDAEKAQDAKRLCEVLAAEKKRKRSEGVRVGMSMQDVLDSSWGRPESVNRTTSAHGTREQWVCGGRNYLYFEDGVLTTIQN